ncbi:tRNA (guanosine(37)-N1)-methyltransferase TrmD [Corynebacterium sp. 13CS0277]|uniref:tRNA (guanosine(37)-N1)-methyltransferase TrmD n=1 Tax=Corynebacterium sp. 13CS0277 TaxID=2071994 RepID=UPI000D032294|nr:tRNA (guanosine(37)-N1)-methyltransferase TrmD [Corynebacterium sp. 13CS0277]PRQ12550.1 tRNA (guanosine(37)-N1)-methyltransferase TrmD [Corynebacterium sp. 13CS0277]
MRLDVVTIFPEYLEPLRHALLGRAIEDGLLSVGVHDLRQWARGVHRAVDDTPYGGGPGMVMMPQVWGPALDDVAAGTGPAAGAAVDSAQPHKAQPTHDAVRGRRAEAYGDADPSAQPGEDPSLPVLIVPTPAGVPFTQAHARAWSREDHLVFACGRYEGIDSRVVVDAQQRYRVREVSIGDYVLIGGEVATLVIAEAVCRLIPGVLGNAESHEDDSFSDGLLEGPSYTKPVQWRGLEVPAVLRSGNHDAIAAWRHEQSLRLTASRRPDLLAEVQLSAADHLILAGRDVDVYAPGLPATGKRAKAVRRRLKDNPAIGDVRARPVEEPPAAEAAGEASIISVRTTLDDAALLTVLRAGGVRDATIVSAPAPHNPTPENP